jgi:hypothetical protein
VSIQSQGAEAEVLALDEIRTFLSVMATAVRDTLGQFEQTTAQVIDLAVMRVGRPDRDLVVTLQTFDRLQQEFATLADVLNLAAGKSRESWLRGTGNGHPAEDAIARVSIAALKDRLLRDLRGAAADLMEAAEPEEAVF